MRSAYRVILGRKNDRAAECISGGFIGVDYGLHVDLTGRLTEKWKEFNRDFIPVLLAKYPAKSRISAGLACGAIWTVAKGINRGDWVVCADGTGAYRVGEVTSEYEYAAGQPLPHRRRVRWHETAIERGSMSEALQRSASSRGTVSDISRHQPEIEQLVQARGTFSSGNEDGIEDGTAFMLEKHLEDFLVENWEQTALGRDFSIFVEDGELVGQQYPTDAGPIDILAVSKDKKRIAVIELKRGRASDVVVGQVLRYMGFVKEQIAEPGQSVEGVIIALEDDQKLRWALLNVPSVSLYRHEVSFKLKKA